MQKVFLQLGNWACSRRARGVLTATGADTWPAGIAGRNCSKTFRSPACHPLGVTSTSALFSKSEFGSRDVGDRRRDLSGRSRCRPCCAAPPQRPEACVHTLGPTNYGASNCWPRARLTTRPRPVSALSGGPTIIATPELHTSRRNDREIQARPLRPPPGATPMPKLMAGFGQRDASSDFNDPLFPRHKTAPILTVAPSSHVRRAHKGCLPSLLLGGTVPPVQDSSRCGIQGTIEPRSASFHAVFRTNHDLRAAGPSGARRGTESTPSLRALLLYGPRPRKCRPSPGWC